MTLIGEGQSFFVLRTFRAGVGVKKHHVKKVQIFWPDVNTVGPDIDIFPISNGASLNWVSPNKQTFCIKIIFILAGSV